MGKIYSVGNFKGGCGKTSTTLNLGAALASAGKSVALIDGDAQGNLTAALGYTPAEQSHTLANLLLAATDYPEDLDFHLQNLACADLIADYDAESQKAFVEMCSVEGYQLNNQVYLANVEPVDDPAYDVAGPIPPETGRGSRTANPEGLETGDIAASPQEPQDLSGKNLQNCGFRTTDSAVTEQQDLRPSNIEKKNTEVSYPDVSQPVGAGDADGQADDEEELMGILLFP